MNKEEYNSIMEVLRKWSEKTRDLEWLNDYSIAYDSISSDATESSLVDERVCTDDERAKALERLKNG